MDPQLVIRVNEVFHDVEGATYARLHPEIFEGEERHWTEALDHLLQTLPKPLRALDFGCGTGFLARLILPHMNAGDALVCADLSTSMLEACKATLSAAHPKCAVEYLKLDGRGVALPDESVDLIAMNSVLHHLPDPGGTLRELGRILKPGGVLAIGHEPNRLFYLSRVARWRAQLLNPRATMGSTLRRLGAIDLVRRIVGRPEHQATLAEVNRRLLAEGAVYKPLSQDELTAIVDVNSPTAGGWHPERGIDLTALRDQHLPGYDLQLVTYDHLGPGRQSARLARTQPLMGATLMATLRKPA
jgi:ubiquinone/menaquinone biosynthesis C-methylase UbiE